MLDETRGRGLASISPYPYFCISSLNKTARKAKKKEKKLTADIENWMKTRKKDNKLTVNIENRMKMDENVKKDSWKH